MVILAGLAAGCLHLAGRGRWGRLESGGGMVTGLVGADFGPLSSATGGSALRRRRRHGPGAIPGLIQITSAFRDLGDRPITDRRAESRDIHLLEETEATEPQARVAEPVG